MFPALMSLEKMIVTTEGLPVEEIRSVEILQSLDCLIHDSRDDIFLLLTTQPLVPPTSNPSS